MAATVYYGVITSSLPKNFGNDALHLSKLLAKKHGMTLYRFLDEEERRLLSNYQNWAINLELPLPDFFPLSQKIFFYRAAESGRSVKDEIELARDAISEFPEVSAQVPPSGDNSSAESKKKQLKPVIIVSFVLVGILCFLVEQDHNAVSQATPSKHNYSNQSIQYIAPTSTPKPTPTPTPVPTPKPTQSHRDGPGISFEEFMQGYEEYKRNGGASYTDTWGEDNTTSEVTGDRGRTAYWMPNGKSYHFTDSCPSLSRSKTICTGTLQDALDAGKTDPCNNCAYG